MIVFDNLKLLLPFIRMSLIGNAGYQIERIESDFKLFINNYG